MTGKILKLAKKELKYWKEYSWKIPDFITGYVFTFDELFQHLQNRAVVQYFHTLLLWPVNIKHVVPNKVLWVKTMCWIFHFSHLPVQLWVFVDIRSRDLNNFWTNWIQLWRIHHQKKQKWLLLPSNNQKLCITSTHNCVLNITTRIEKPRQGKLRNNVAKNDTTHTPWKWGNITIRPNMEEKMSHCLSQCFDLHSPFCFFSINKRDQRGVGPCSSGWPQLRLQAQPAGSCGPHLYYTRILNYSFFSVKQRHPPTFRRGFRNDPSASMVTMATSITHKLENCEKTLKQENESQNVSKYFCFYLYYCLWWLFPSPKNDYIDKKTCQLHMGNHQISHTRKLMNEGRKVGGLCWKFKAVLSEKCSNIKRKDWQSANLDQKQKS